MRTRNVKGRLYTSNPHNAKKVPNADEYWLITRAGIEIPNTIRVKELSPSPALFNQFIKEWKGSEPKTWWAEYSNQFKREIESQEKKEKLRELYKSIVQGKVIVLICFCQDHRYCHRSLVANFLNKYGIDTEELDPVNSDQIAFQFFSEGKE